MNEVSKSFCQEHQIIIKLGQLLAEHLEYPQHFARKGKKLKSACSSLSQEYYNLGQEATSTYKNEKCVIHCIGTEKGYRNLKQTDQQGLEL